MSDGKGGAFLHMQVTYLKYEVLLLFRTLWFYSTSYYVKEFKFITLQCFLQPLKSIKGTTGGLLCCEKGLIFMMLLQQS